MLKQTFTSLLTTYTTNNSIIEKLWVEIEKSYTNKKRHYHTLQHLDNMLHQLNEVKDGIKNWDVILFSLFYHDIIYNILRQDNEAKSAVVAEKRMKEIAVEGSIIEACSKMILATAAHNESTDEDTNYFTDADLSILGQDWETYSRYYNNIRKEYSVYPNLVYNPGRKKVLSHFLSMDSIYKTNFFYNKFETKAKENLQRELKYLNQFKLKLTEMTEIYAQDKTFEGNDFTQTPLPKGEYENCIFNNCNFESNDFSGYKFIDCEFNGCNVSLVKLTKTSFRDVKFKDCKMLGLHFDTCNEFGLSFSFDGCQLNHSSFYKTKIKKTVFKNSLLQETDFTEADLTSAVFDNCNLAQAIFDNTILEKASFLTSYNYSINPEVNRIKKAKFSITGVAGLLDKWDIEIGNG